MAKITRVQAVALLESVRKPRNSGIKVGLTHAESEDVLEAYIDLLDKFERIRTCR